MAPKMNEQKQTLILTVIIMSIVSTAVFADTLFDPNNNEIAIIPKPMETRLTGGVFTLKFTTSIHFEGNSTEIRNIANYLAEHLRPATGLSLVVLDGANAKSSTDSILLTTKNSDKSLGMEGYELVVTKNRIILRAPRLAGLFYGVQTIRQLLPADIDSRKKLTDTCWTIPCVQIKDKPRFQWRGSLLDSSRHFMTKDFVKRYIDLLAYHKMNRFHWHVTDDQGWRIEIKKYPKLTEVGAWRNTDDGNLKSEKEIIGSEYSPDDVYGGFYTQEDVADIVRYAKSRYVMIVPEVEMPGHSLSALAAYPSLSCKGGPFKVASCRGVFKDVYCAGEDKVFEFLEDVLSEVIQLFPGPYIHIGGDECPKDRWKNCTRCQARIKAEGLNDEGELQSYFIKRLEKFLQSKNRHLIGWDEILEGGLAPNAIVQSWRGMAGAVAAVRAGHDTIVSPTAYCYFDYDLGATGLKRVYSFEPIPPDLTPEQQRHILGGEGNIWTEHIPQEVVDFWAFPRLSALAEVLWSSKELRNWEDFSRRIELQYHRFDIMGVGYKTEQEKQ